MTALQKYIKYSLKWHGFTRRCDCYKAKCLVLPESMVDMVVETIARRVQFTGPIPLPVREITEKEDTGT